MRHLHETGGLFTICGRDREGTLSVHVSKARASDCEDCRVIYRVILRVRRTGQIPAPVNP